MDKFGYCCIILLILVLGGQSCEAARLKAYVNVFSVSIPENKEELKVSLQTLLMSRLNSEEIQAVESQGDAEIQVFGSYIVFGTVFSLDAVIKTTAGLFVDRVFVQGDTQNELIPSVAEMAKRLRRSILRWNGAPNVRLSADTPEFAVEKAPTVIDRKDPRSESKPANITTQQKVPEKPWLSQQFPETLNGIASGRTVAAEGTEIFVTGEHYLRYYLRGSRLQQLAEIVFDADQKVLGVDVADLDNNGVPEVYVSILKGGLPASQVYLPENSQLQKVKENIPYLLRGIALEGKEKKIYAQKMEVTGNFSGDIFELLKSGDEFIAKNPLQLPLLANLYNFNRFIDSKGRPLFVVLHPDGYLLVYSKDKKQLWKSRDKFGGSELPACRAERNDPASPLPKVCLISLPQRLLVTGPGEVIVSRNTGVSTTGAMRNYTKNNLVQLSWNGGSLQEKWRSEQSQNYLADFSYDERSREFLLLEVTPEVDSGGERGSRVVVKRRE